MSKYLNEVTHKREKVEEEINEDSASREELIKTHEKIKQELEKVNRKLDEDYKNLTELDRIINNTESAYNKVSIEIIRI